MKTTTKPRRRRNVKAAEDRREKLLAENTPEERSAWAREMNEKKRARRERAPEERRQRLAEIEREITEAGAEVDRLALKAGEIKPGEGDPRHAERHAARERLRLLVEAASDLRWGKSRRAA